MSNKVLLVLWGESFRSGGQMTRTRGTGEYFENQKSATSSHLELLDRIHKEHSFDCDILLNSFTLNPEDDNSLISWYSNYASNFFSTKLLLSKFIYHLHGQGFSGEEYTRWDTYDKAVDIIDDYEYVLFVRVDLLLKKYFIDNFYFDPEKIKFAHLDMNLKNSPPMDKLSVCDQIMLFPKKFFYTIKEKIIYRFPHETRKVLIKHDNNLINKIDYFIHTLHICSTDLGWNPLYWQVGRNKNRSYDNSNVGKHAGDVDFYYDISDHKLKRGSNWKERYKDIPRTREGEFID